MQEYNPKELPQVREQLLRIAPLQVIAYSSSHYTTATPSVMKSREKQPSMNTPRFSRRKMLALSSTALAGVATASVPTTAIAQEAGAPDTRVGLAWPKRRQKIERGWLDLLGEFPSEIPALSPAMKQVAHEGGITRYHVSFQSEADDRVIAWLLVPDSARLRPTPAMICIHSTTEGAGKDLAIGLSGKTSDAPPDTWEGGRAYGLHLARYGYVTLSIDLLTDGERCPPGERLHDTRPFYLKHPEWSIVGKNTWDIMRSVDFLQTLDFVDHHHIGCVGLSLGGHTALFAGAFESRLGATITDGGVLDWHRNATHWGRGDTPVLSHRGPYIYIRKFRPYISDKTKPIPVDFDELMMMVAPRPLLVLSSEWEYYSHKIIPKCLATAQVYAAWRDTEGLPSVQRAREQRASYRDTLNYYWDRYQIKAERMPGMLEVLGAGDCFSWFSFPGGHSYPSVARRYSFAWLDRWLGHTPPNHNQV